MRHLSLLMAGALLACNAIAHSPPEHHEPAGGDTRLRQAGIPRIAVERGLRLPRRAELRVLYGQAQGAFPHDCSVDFGDFDALNAIPEQAYAVAGPPWWFQSCGGTLGNYAVVRPVHYGHLHLNFEDASIGCLAPDGLTFGRIQPDGTCSSAGISHALEPRSVQAHWGDEQLHVYVVNQFVDPNDPYSDSTTDKKPFDMKRLRVLGTPVRVCYKKVQEIEGPWIVSPDVHQGGSTPGVWLCWNRLTAGLWDLSNWATQVREVKITATDGVTTFQVDDVLIGVQ